jgi:hypothetical protein
MRLYELTGVKKFHHLSQYELEGMLAKDGVKLVSGGQYGTVYAKDDWDYVVKVINKDDPYYMSFVNYAIAHPSQHFPKFKRKPLHMHAFLRRGKYDLDKFWIVKIEKLQPIKDKNLIDFVVHNIEYYGTLMWQLKNKIQSAVDSYHQKHEYATRVFADGSYHKNLSNADVIAAHPWFADLALTYSEMMSSEEVEGSPDIHAGNFMQRSDGTIVIIDPVWEGSNPMKEFYQAMARETDAYYYDEREVEDKSGPVYKHHIAAAAAAEAKAKQAKEAEKAKKAMARQLINDIDDDIPF